MKITLDGTVYEAEPGQTILEVARANGINIPTLCYMPGLPPFGAVSYTHLTLPTIYSV